MGLLACCFGCEGAVDGEVEKQKRSTRHKSQKGLQGDGGPIGRAIPASEVAQHNTAASCWVVYKGKVYDVTPYLKSHPGGPESILDVAGGDMTEMFDAVHAYAAKSLEKYYIGEYVEDQLGDATAIVTAGPSNTAPATLQGRQRVDLVLSEKIRVSQDTVILRFALPSPKHRLGCPVGQHVQMFGVLPNGEKVMRAYTPVTCDHDLGRMDILFKIYPGQAPNIPPGKMGVVVSRLKVGQPLGFMGPTGHFTYEGRGRYAIRGVTGPLTPPVRLMTMVAGGTGIAPMFDVIKSVLRDPKDPTLISLMYSNRYESDMLLKEELDALAAEHPQRFTVLYVLSQPPPNWSLGYAGRITQRLVHDHAFLGAADTLGLVSGPPGLEQQVAVPGLKALGYDEQHIVVF